MDALRGSGGFDGSRLCAVRILWRGYPRYYPGNYYGGYYPGCYPLGYDRPFNRVILPLIALTPLALLPY
ncbi:hypothetical protein DQX05_04405 [Paenibacillus thiaminolyticus]|uniref:Uncharacterized protein n=1 Tax=Paenibacillus thiaminolyticus TaxID=49283 RepID=A0A3A3H7X2_PANTH|nr:hypothetical protein DQX05_04405 [Paenibacillus thiaminolyticus]